MEGLSVWIPGNPEAILRGHYGDGWKVPDPGYSTDKTHKDKRGRAIWNETLATLREMRVMGFPITFCNHSQV